MPCPAVSRCVGNCPLRPVDAFPNTRSASAPCSHECRPVWSAGWRDPAVPAPPAGRRPRPGGGWRSCGGGRGGGSGPASGGRGAAARPGARAGFPGGCRRGPPGGLSAPGHGRPRARPARHGAASAQRSWMSTWRCLAPLAGHRDHPPGQVQVVHVEAAELGHPQPAPVEQLQHGVVPAVDLRGRPGPAPAAGSSSWPSSAWPSTRGRRESGRRGRQAGRGVAVDQAPLGAPLEVGAERGGGAGDGGLGVPAGGQEGQVAAQHDPVDVAGALGPAPGGPLGERARCRSSRPAPTPATARPPSGGRLRSPRTRKTVPVQAVPGPVPSDGRRHPGRRADLYPRAIPRGLSSGASARRVAQRTCDGQQQAPEPVREAGESGLLGHCPKGEHVRSNRPPLVLGQGGGHRGRHRRHRHLGRPPGRLQLGLGLGSSTSHRLPPRRDLDGHAQGRRVSSIFGVDAEEKGFSPTQGTFDEAGILYARTVFDPLMIIAADGTPEPYLAESVTPNADYTVWTITMRPNLVFHNGTAVRRRRRGRQLRGPQGVRPHRPGPHHRRHGHRPPARWW